MPTQIDIIIEFKNQLIAFFDELISQFPTEGDLVVMRLFISTQMDIPETLNKFILELNVNNTSTRKAIVDKDESYFISYNILPETNKKYKLTHFKTLWRSGQLDKDDKDIIWSWIDTFTKIADRYQTVSST
jgi:hypothetical protein